MCCEGFVQTRIVGLEMAREPGIEPLRPCALLEYEPARLRAEVDDEYLVGAATSCLSSIRCMIGTRSGGLAAAAGTGSVDIDMSKPRHRGGRTLVSFARNGFDRDQGAALESNIFYTAVDRAKERPCACASNCWEQASWQ